ncbi:SusE domain-containing protein [Flammeovirga kamogawensis]|uniref:SusE domain-containing protein n=1 Tax=Flammeovirga kamogawensis TaxID=373891 RepID=A0ABX8GYV4_9BACT|nr:SusE domain-containing protein [Flammeovirga kamogawensis]MBB6459027.1 hypothetical protein [Flammeovirga kamogawensis]QWG08599.1 SusE domain-containing protein [Flammeovirga kamogawensis]TRX66891.1 hypothetical protein EO216_01630 [Flammeovirga kamogawensis]
MRFNNLYINILSFTFLILVSCQTQEKTVYHPSNSISPILEDPITKTEYIFTEDNLPEDWETVSWSEANLGVTAATQYAVQVALQGDSTNVATILETTNLTANITNEEINKALNELEVSPGNITDFDIRVKAFAGKLETPVEGIQALPSNHFGFAAAVFAQATEVFLVGSFSGWNPESTEFALEKTSDIKFTGVHYIEKDGENNAVFKVLEFLGDWGSEWNYTAFEGRHSSNIQKDAGESTNIVLNDEARNYHFEIDATDPEKKTLQVRKYGIFKVGSENGWNNAGETIMEFIPTAEDENVLVYTGPLKSGEEFKFVNVLGSWDYGNYGFSEISSAASVIKLEEKGGNFNYTGADLATATFTLNIETKTLSVE